MKNKMIDLKKICTKHPELTKAKLGELFFHAHKHPDKAAERLLTGQTEMSESQITTLASFLAVKPGDLFDSELQSGWLNRSENGGLFTLQKGRYTATFDTEEGITTLFCENTKINEFIVSKITPVGEFISALDKAIVLNELNIEDLS